MRKTSLLPLLSWHSGLSIGDSLQQIANIEAERGFKVKYTTRAVPRPPSHLRRVNNRYILKVYSAFPKRLPLVGC